MWFDAGPLDRPMHVKSPEGDVETVYLGTRWNSLSHPPQVSAWENPQHVLQGVHLYVQRIAPSPHFHTVSTKSEEGPLGVRVAGDLKRASRTQQRLPSRRLAMPR